MNAGVRLIGLVVLVLMACRRDAARDAVADSASTAPAGKPGLIELTRPLPNAVVTSPLTLEGRAKGPWYFEASFPVYLLNAAGDTIARAPATAQGEWMTTEFVAFTATLTFQAPAGSTGTLILQKSNASGLPEHDDELRLNVRF